ncbi:DUF6119 family protein [Anaerorhabdus furcosa]|uniref:Sporadically distributed protein, TIGR04141 family n=1 Tax=Anaerorhabdus furcosa TaxID=118967 RepID=A0A1T4PXG7_9FIRM|nr:DUF6119 family protein [Anaerorhabdus furcosa]SJZ96250.1 sporadically distributed protein, TIGR04141 family [Anaerorhabdus furcosa]
MAKKSDKILYDYNIYRIQFEKHDDFIGFLEERKFEEIPLKQDLLKPDSSVSFTLMYCDKDNKDGSQWVKILSSCAEQKLEQDVRVYGAALVCKGVDFCYVISYGNAHFYAGKYCDYNFGVSVAERLIDLESIKAQQNVSHGSKLSKTHFDYIKNAPITYGSGEIPTFIKGESIDPEYWGANITCGISTQFKWEESPLQIGEKLSALDTVCKTKSDISLPRLLPLDEEIYVDKIAELYLKLAEAIRDYDPAKIADYFSVPSFYLLGTKIMQTDFSKYKLSCNHKVQEFDGELSIFSVKQFLDVNGYDIISHIQKINIAVEYSTGQFSALKPITEYMEFICTDKMSNSFCLRNGKWCSFNNAYVERIISSVARIKYVNHIDDDLCFNKTALMDFAKETGIFVDREHQPIEGYFNHRLEEILSATSQHPTTQKFEEGYNFRYEPCDLFTTDTLYFVKIGEPSDFAMAIDQAGVTLQKLRTSNNVIELINNTLVTPLEFVLILVFDKRSSIITQWKDINSLNFLIHLSDLQKDLNLSGITLKVDFCYGAIQI